MPTYEEEQNKELKKSVCKESPQQQSQNNTPLIRSQMPPGMSLHQFQTQQSSSLVHTWNNTGIPSPMKQQFEEKSGLSFDDVKVHYNSNKPAKLGALAYTQGNQVHIGAGQERHLAHELGHVVQQKQGIVKPTGYVNGVSVNEDRKLEKEAESYQFKKNPINTTQNFVVQKYVHFQDGYKNFDEAIVDKAFFERPAGTGGGNHTTSITLFQQAAMNAVIGCTYHQALSELVIRAKWIGDFPNYIGNDAIEQYISYLDSLKSDQNVLNWSMNLDYAANKYILLRNNNVALTIHNEGKGEEGNHGEQKAIDELDGQVKAIESEECDYQAVTTAIMQLLDYKNCFNTIDDCGYLEIIWSQHVRSVCHAYPILLNDPRVFDDALIRIIDEIVANKDSGLKNFLHENLEKHIANINFDLPLTWQE